MFVERYVDYAQFSLPYTIEYTVSMMSEYDRPTGVEPSSMRGYRQVTTLESGMQIHTGHKTGKPLVRMTGRACDGVFADVSSSQFFEHMVSMGAKFSRVDWAITQYIDHDGLVLPEHWLQSFANGLTHHPLWERGNNVISSFDRDDRKIKAETVYIGNLRDRAKHGVLRSYDRGLDIDIGRFLIVNTELEEKRDKAHTSAVRHSEGATVGEVFASRVETWDSALLRIINSEPVDTARGKQKAVQDGEDNVNRWHWLITQVAPSLGKQLATDGVEPDDNPNYDLFWDKVRSAYNGELRKRG